MSKQKIVILVLLIIGVAGMYYFVQKDRNAPEKEPPPPENLPAAPEVKPPADPNAGKIISESTVKEELKYYSLTNHPLQNPFLNPIIMPGFVVTQLFKKKKKKQ